MLPRHNNCRFSLPRALILLLLGINFLPRHQKRVTTLPRRVLVLLGSDHCRVPEKSCFRCRDHYSHARPRRFSAPAQEHAVFSAAPARFRAIPAVSLSVFFCVFIANFTRFPIRFFENHRHSLSTHTIRSFPIRLALLLLTGCSIDWLPVLCFVKKKICSAVRHIVAEREVLQ